MYLRQIYRIYPKKFQIEILNQSLGNARFVWNHYLSENIKSYKESKKFKFYNENANNLLDLKKQFDWLKLSHSQTLQQKLRDLDSALKQSFKKNKNKKGFPKFKSKSSDCSGIRFPQGYKVDYSYGIKLPKIDKWIRTKFDRKLLGLAKSVTVYKNKCNQWYVSFVVDVGNNFCKPEVTEINNMVGIDLGIKSFAVTSDGEVIENPKFLRKSENKLKKLQKKHSKKVKGSRNREKSRKKLAKQHLKVKNRRKDFIKQTASTIAKLNDLVVCEDLNVQGMVKNHKLAKSISDVGFGMFLIELEWQCKKRGKIFHKVDRWYPSSKTCNHCGYIKKDLVLSQREWICPECGSIMDRDYNASLNILNQGLEDLNLIPQELRKFTPVTNGCISWQSDWASRDNQSRKPQML